MNLTEEQKGHKRRYQTSTYNFLYWTLNVDVITAFMRKMKYKPDQFTTGGKTVHYSFSHLYKFHDAILFGANQAKVTLPEVYEIELQSYLESIKKEKIKAKNRGELEEKESNSISFEQYRILCEYKIETGNIFI